MKEAQLLSRLSELFEVVKSKEKNKAKLRSAGPMIVAYFNHSFPQRILKKTETITVM